MASVLVVASEVSSISSEILLTLSGGLVIGSKLVPNMSVAFTRPGVRTEITETGGALVI